MKELHVGQNEAGQRLIRLLSKYLREAPEPFLYRMLRKKNIVLNDRRATGRERLAAGDTVRIYMADGTIAKFRGVTDGGQAPVTAFTEEEMRRFAQRVVYEDDQILIVDKPAGMLSQRASSEDTALTDYITAYLVRRGELTEEDLETFRPGIVSRLDRNTSGLVTAGKTLAALQALNDLVRDHRIRKYYAALVEGALTAPVTLTGGWSKDERTNTVRITKSASKSAAEVVTKVRPREVLRGRDLTCTLVRVELETGKGHQIRAHLASAGHPILGDIKYGGRTMKGRRGQYLHACELSFPEAQEMPEVLRAAAARRITSPLPEEFTRVIEQLKI